MQRPVASTVSPQSGGATSCRQHAVELFLRLGLVFRQLERYVANAFLHGAAADALRANANGFVRAVVRGDLDPLQVRLERTFGQAGDFRPKSAKVFRLTARRHLIAERPPFSATFTNSCHFA